jgi:hypothetical protein
MQNLNMPARILTALYDARGAAERARDELLALGVSRNDVTLRGTGPQATTEPATGERSFWEDIGATPLPARDRCLLDEGVRRGGCLLVARVPESLADRSQQAMGRFGPVDVEERVAEWHRSGWHEPEAAASRAVEGEITPPPPEEDPRFVGGFGESIAYAAEPGGGGTIRRRVRSYPVGPARA